MEEMFESLWFRYKKTIYNYLLGGTHHEADAEDLLQTVALKAYSSLSTLQSEEAFYSWIMTIARRTLIDHWRTNIPEPIEIEDKKESLYHMVTHDHACSVLTKKVVADFIAGLSEPWATALYMNLYFGTTYQELAEFMHKREDTVYKHLYRLKEQLQATLKRGEHE